jgi:DegV family protein with EDD domain
MKFKIVADASCDIPKEFMEKYDITIIPIEVRFGEEMYPEGLETREFYNKMQSTGIIPKTSMPNAYKFEEFYKDYANKDDVFVITVLISMEMSTTKIQAQMAADNLGMKNVFIEESTVTTLAQGALIVELCKFIEKEQDIEKIKEEFYRLRNNIHSYFIINDLKYLKQSGRLSSASEILGSMLSVKPIVGIIDGKVVNVAKCMGLNKAEAYLLDKVQNLDDSKYFYIAHSDTLESAEKLKNKVAKIIPSNQEIVIGEIGCVVGSHVGAKCYGLIYFSK